MCKQPHTWQWEKVTEAERREAAAARVMAANMARKYPYEDADARIRRLAQEFLDSDPQP